MRCSRMKALTHAGNYKLWFVSEKDECIEDEKLNDPSG